MKKIQSDSVVTIAKSWPIRKNRIGQLFEKSCIINLDTSLIMHEQFALTHVHPHMDGQPAPYDNRQVLVTGAKGQLGFDVRKHLNVRSITNKGVHLEDFDLTDRQQTYDAIIYYGSDVIVYCAAYTAVDKTETNQDICHRVNVEGTSHVAQAVKYLDAKMIYMFYVAYNT